MTKKNDKGNEMLWLRIKHLFGIVSREQLGELLLFAKIEKSGFFNKRWYLAQNPDVKAAKMNPIKHYMKFGWREGRNPSPKFDTNYYLEMNPDVRNANMNPLNHYVQFGRAEGRAIKSVASSGENKYSFMSKLKYTFEYPIRVHNEYHRLKDEIRNLKNSK